MSGIIQAFGNICQFFFRIFYDILTKFVILKIKKHLQCTFLCKNKFYFSSNFSFNAFSTKGGTILLMSPPKRAASFMLEDLTRKYFCSVGRKSVSMSEPSCLFMRDKSNSWAKSMALRTPLTRTVAFSLLQ